MEQIFKTIIYSLIVVLISTAIVTTVVKAGSLTPTATPQATLYTLSDIYTRLTTNIAATEASHTLQPAGSPAGTFYTLKQIYDAVPTIDASKVLSGTTYLGVAGTITNGSNVTGSNGSLSISIPTGYYSGKTATASDTNLIQSNIKNGTTIFGVTGNLSSGGLPKTGQTIVYATNDDGTFQKGAPASGAHFADNGDGTVTDNATGLIWVKNPGVIEVGGYVFAWGYSWTDALLAIAALNTSNYLGHSDWRLPNIRELQSIVNYGNYNLAVGESTGSQAPFNLNPSTYWSSTTSISATTGAWYVEFGKGTANDNLKSGSGFILPVRGG